MACVQVPGVVYSENELLPGQLMFGCSRMSATLRVQACVDMWKQANEGPAPVERLLRCRACPVGAAHAGIADATHHRLRGTTVCARCHRMHLRLIGGNICVGCKNREYEWLRGKNAKGKFPTQHPTLRRHRVNFCADGKPGVLVRDRASCTTELVVEMLRESGGRVLFGLGRPGVSRG